MSQETRLSNRLLKTLKKFHAIPVENPKCPGTPDISYIGGWVETKALDEWPKKEKTPLRVDTFTDKQRIWLKKEAACGGNAFVMLQIGKEYLILDGLYAANYLGYSTKAELIENALWYSSTFPTVDLLTTIGF
jgi:hypothetical protein